MIQICVLAIAGLFAALIIKKDKPEFAVLIIMLVSFFIALRILTILGNAVEDLESWESILGGNIVCDFAANLCKDSGYAALSNHIELFGKVAIMVAGFPVIRIMIDMLEGMMR